MTIGIYKNRGGIVNRLLLLLIVIYCVSCMISVFSLGLSRGIQVCTLVVLFILNISVCYRKKSFVRISKLLIVFIFIILFYRLFEYSLSGWGNCLMQISFFIPLVYVVYGLSRNNRIDNIVIYYFILALVLFIIIKDISIGREYTDASLRELGEEGSSVASTEFNTMMYLVYNTCLIVALNCKNRIHRFIHLALLPLTIFYIIFLGMRGSLTVFLFLSTFLIVYSKYYYKGGIYKAIGIIVFLLILSLLLIDTDSILNFVISISPNDRLTERMRDLAMISESGITDDSFSGRLKLEIISIETWTRNFVTFFFGIGDHRLSEWGIQGLIMSGIGGHSELIDSLARFGLIGFSVIIALLYNISRYVVSLFDGILVRKQVSIFFIMLFVIALTKGVFYHFIGIVSFILMPLSVLIINEQKQKIK